MDVIQRRREYDARPATTMRILRRAASFLAVASVAACHRPIAHLNIPQQSAVALTGGGGTSMIYLARTKDGVLAIDLGWSGYRGPVDRALKSLGATAADVRWVFVTHAHRDHISAWPAFRSATFHMAAPEVPLFVGRRESRSWIPRLADRLKRPNRPRPGELTIGAFSRDTTFTFGSDTLRAYVVPGHTPGSTVYVFRGVLFAGDAVSWSSAGGFAPAKHQYSDDPRAAARNLENLWPLLPAGAVRYVCTAHARCTLFTAQFLEDVER